MTTLLYAVGTGHGHLVRARAFARTHPHPLHVFTTHPRAAELLGEVPHTVVDDALRADGPALRRALDGVVDLLGVSHVILDVFAAGIRDELVGWAPPGGSVSVLARRLAAAPTGAGPPIHTAYLCEDLAPWQTAWLQARAQHLVSAHLEDPPAMIPPPLRSWLAQAPRPVWAVVHSGPPAELQLLLDHARDDAFARGCTPTLLVVHPSPPACPGATCCSLSPAWPLFSEVDRVVGAAGFNLVRQCEAAGVELLPIPLPRRFDDQAGRARAYRARLTRGRLAPRRTPEALPATSRRGSAR